MPTSVESYVICYYDNRGYCYVYTGNVTSLGMTNPTYARYDPTLSTIVRYTTYQAALTVAKKIEGAQNTFPLQVCRLVE